jgi:hypothetical protein
LWYIIFTSFNDVFQKEYSPLINFNKIKRQITFA